MISEQYMVGPPAAQQPNPQENYYPLDLPFQLPPPGTPLIRHKFLIEQRVNQTAAPDPSPNNNLVPITPVISSNRGSRQGGTTTVASSSG